MVFVQIHYCMGDELTDGKNSKITGVQVPFFITLAVHFIESPVFNCCFGSGSNSSKGPLCSRSSILMEKSSTSGISGVKENFILPSGMTALMPQIPLVFSYSQSPPAICSVLGQGAKLQLGNILVTLDPSGHNLASCVQATISFLIVSLKTSLAPMTIISALSIAAIIIIPIAKVVLILIFIYFVAFF